LNIPSQQFAVGLAEGLGTPVTLEGTAAADDRAEYLLTYRWGEAITDD